MRLLLLAGTAEARQIARALQREPRVHALASLAGATRTPEPVGIPTRIGGFGGREGFAEFLVQSRMHAVLDVTHPFSAGMSRRSAEVCAELGLPYLMFLRPAWTPDPDDNWVFLNDETDAARHIPMGASVFLATGRQSLPRFAALNGRTVYLRQIDPPSGPFPFPRGGVVQGRPPFSVASEEQLFMDLGIDWLVVKNSGGGGGRTKLDAARNLGIPVAMLRRPLQPEVPRVSTVAGALAWVRGLV